MAKQIHWEDVEDGMELPPVVKHPTTMQLVRYAGASGDLSRIHYDQEYARNRGFPTVIVHGQLKWGFLAQLLTDWIGYEGRIKKIACQYRRIDVPGDTLTCKGKVVRKYVEDGIHQVECDIWVENGRGEVTTPGSATVILPSRSQCE